tara:strand:+ start:182 stop:622 length:441 start_codon:yes stop_codon:yes gene_type:complete
MKFTYTADDGTTFDTADECNLYEKELSKTAARGWPSEVTPDKEKEWVATYERIESKITILKSKLYRVSSDLVGDIERRIKEAEEIREKIVGRLGYTPKTLIDDDLEELKQSIEDGTSSLSHLPDDAWIGPKGGIYRRNSKGGRTYI